MVYSGPTWLVGLPATENVGLPATENVGAFGNSGNGKLKWSK